MNGAPKRPMLVRLLSDFFRGGVAPWTLRTLVDPGATLIQSRSP